MRPLPYIRENSWIYAIFIISDRDSTTSESYIFNICTEMSSWPCALTVKFLIILRISSFSKEIEFTPEWVLQDITDSKTLLLVKGVHWVPKKPLKRFNFFVKSDAILLLTNNGETYGTLVSL